MAIVYRRQREVNILAMTGNEIRKTSYDGTVKNLTLDCETCPFFPNQVQRQQLETVFRTANKLRKYPGLCLHGKHLIALAVPEIMTKCRVIESSPTGQPRWKLIYDLYHDIKNALIVKRKTYSEEVFKQVIE